MFQRFEKGVGGGGLAMERAKNVEDNDISKGVRVVSDSL